MYSVLSDKSYLYIYTDKYKCPELFCQAFFLGKRRIGDLQKKAGGKPGRRCRGVQQKQGLGEILLREISAG
jgi:hypothetical protein